MSDETRENSEPTGAFMDSLVRSNKQIKHDRAEVIAEDAQLRFKRVVEDMEMDLKRMQRERLNMLDLSPENAHSLMLGKDFDSESFVKKDLRLSVDMRNREIELGIAKERYAHLFGEAV